MTRRAIYFILAVTAIGAAWLQAQAEQRFEVASIRPNTVVRPPLGEIDFSFQRAVAQASRNGTFHLSMTSLHFLIRIAYDVNDDQIIGEPPWANSDLYDITAKAGNDASFEQMRPMLQSLLTERFNLKLHKGTKELPVYELTVGRGGLKIPQGAEANCLKLDPNGEPPAFGSKICGGYRFRVTQPGRYRFEGFSIPMSKFVEALADHVGRVVDKTGFSGTFTFQLDYEDAAPTSNSVPATGADPNRLTPGKDLQGRTIFTALQEDLGLRLQPVKGQVEALIIDHVERASPN